MADSIRYSIITDTADVQFSLHRMFEPFYDSAVVAHGTDTIRKDPVKTFFTTASRIDKNLTSRDKMNINTDWLTIHLVILLMVVAWARFFFGKRFNQVFQSFFNQRSMNIMQREGNIFTERISIALLVIYLVTTSLMIYVAITRLSDMQNLPYTGFKLYALIILGVLLLWILKNLFINTVGIIFKNQVLISEYLLINFIFNVNIGIFFIPLIILVVYYPSGFMLTAGLILWVMAFIYRIFRLFFTEMGYTKFSYVNRILYLCTFEIAPFIVFIKLIMNELA